MNIVNVIKKIEEKYPLNLAYEWDNVGLMLGSYNYPVKKILVALDLTKAVLKEAKENKVDLIITHHPFFFTPLKTLNFDTHKGHMIKELIENNITVYSMHTNFDVADYGMNYALATKLGIKNQTLLDVKENIGVMGDIEPIKVEDFISFVKKELNIDDVKYYGKLNKIIKKVGISGGSGSKHIGASKFQGCDIYLTGDITYHTALDIHAMGHNVLDINHFAEKIFIPYMANFIRENFNDIEVIESKVDTCPYIVF